MLRKRTFFLFAVCLCVVSAYGEGEWLSEIPKANRAKAGALFASLKTMQERLREDYENAVEAEKSYARAARSLARALDTANADAVSDLADGKKALSDQRRLRWESARDLSEKRYGRAGVRGFESALAMEPILDNEGERFAALIGKYVPRMSRKAFSGLTRDLEARTALHPDCPQTAFRSLCSAAASSPPADRRAWALSLSSGLPSGPLAAFSARMPASDSSAVQNDLFAAALVAFKASLDAGTNLRVLLPAAAAASWFVDSSGVSLHPPAAASLAGAAAALSASSIESMKTALAEFPALDAAFSEYLSWLWVAQREDAPALQAVVGLDPDKTSGVLEAAWRIRGEAAAVPPPPVLSLASIRSAERMSAFIETKPAEAEMIAAFATLRTDAAALRAFALGSRYKEARERVSAVYSPLADASAEAASGNGKLVFAGTADPFAPAVVAAREDGQSVMPERFAVAYALLQASALGRRGQNKDSVDNVSWLEARAYLFSLPFLADAAFPDSRELEALSDGAVFFPPVARDAAARELRSGLLRERLRSDAALLGIPARFVDAGDDLPRSMAIFYSCAARNAEKLKSGATR